MAQFYKEYDSSTSALNGFICDAYLDLSVLRYMEKLAFLKVSKTELDEESQSQEEELLSIDNLCAKKTYDRQQ